MLPVRDAIYAFWGSVDNNMTNIEARRIIHVGKSVERLDMYMRLRYPQEDISAELNNLLKHILRYAENGSKLVNKAAFEYSTELLFEGSVTEHCFTLRCVPFSDGRQLVSEPKCEILPRCGSIWSSRDSFGNSLICGRIAEAHGSFPFHVTGEAEIVNSDFIFGTASPVYGYFSPLSAAWESILEFRKNFCRK